MEDSLKELDIFFTRLKTQAVTKATRKALNRTATQVRNYSVKRFTRERKLSPAALKRRIFLRKAKGNDLMRLQSQVIYTGIPLPLILFISGVKKPRRNTNRPRVFEIKKGDKKAKRGLFVAKAKHGKERYQVFRRKDPSSSTNKKMVKQATSSVVELFRQRVRIQSSIKTVAKRQFKKNLNSQLTFELAKLK